MSEPLPRRVSLERALHLLTGHMDATAWSKARTLAEDALRVPDSEHIAARLNAAHRSGQLVMLVKAQRACQSVAAADLQDIMRELVTKQCVGRIADIEILAPTPSDSVDPVDHLDVAQLRDLVRTIRDILYLEPDGMDPDKELDSDAIGYISAAFLEAGLHPDPVTIDDVTAVAAGPHGEA